MILNICLTHHTNSDPRKTIVSEQEVRSNPLTFGIAMLICKPDLEKLLISPFKFSATLDTLFPLHAT